MCTGFPDSLVFMLAVLGGVYVMFWLAVLTGIAVQRAWRNVTNPR